MYSLQRKCSTKTGVLILEFLLNSKGSKLDWSIKKTHLTHKIGKCKLCDYFLKIDQYIVYTYIYIYMYHI